MKNKILMVLFLFAIFVLVSDCPPVRLCEPAYAQVDGETANAPSAESGGINEPVVRDGSSKEKAIIIKGLIFSELANEEREISNRFGKQVETIERTESGDLAEPGHRVYSLRKIRLQSGEEKEVYFDMSEPASGHGIPFVDRMNEAGASDDAAIAKTDAINKKDGRDGSFKEKAIIIAAASSPDDLMKREILRRFGSRKAKTLVWRDIDDRDGKHYIFQRMILESGKEIGLYFDVTAPLHRNYGFAGFFMLGFWIIVLGLVGAAVCLPIWALIKWEGTWRLAALLPLIFIVYSLVAILAKPTNLFPIAIIFAAAMSIGIFGVLCLIREMLKVR